MSTALDDRLHQREFAADRAGEVEGVELSAVVELERGMHEDVEPEALAFGPERIERRDHRATNRYNATMVADAPTRFFKFGNLSRCLRPSAVKCSDQIDDENYKRNNRSILEITITF